MAIARKQAEQATHQQQRTNPHAAHTHASGEPDVQYVNVSAV